LQLIQLQLFLKFLQLLQVQLVAGFAALTEFDMGELAPAHHKT
jgi:hypothetical protein